MLSTRSSILETSALHTASRPHPSARAVFGGGFLRSIPLLFLLLALLGTAGEMASAASLIRSPELSLRTRSDDLRWTISGSNVDILSELSWKEIQSLVLAGRLVLDGKSVQEGEGGWSFELEGEYGLVYDGDGRDSDYAVSGRTAEFSRSHHKVSGDHVTRLSLALGRQWGEASGMFRLFGGYCWDLLDLSLTQGYQLIDLVGEYEGPIYGLHSSCEARWQGPFAGIAWRGFYDQWLLSAELRYHRYS